MHALGIWKFLVIWVLSSGPNKDLQRPPPLAAALADAQADLPFAMSAVVHELYTGEGRHAYNGHTEVYNTAERDPLEANETAFEAQHDRRLPLPPIISYSPGYSLRTFVSSLTHHSRRISSAPSCRTSQIYKHHTWIRLILNYISFCLSITPLSNINNYI